MSPLTASAVVLAIVVLTTVLGWRLRVVRGRARRQSGAEDVSADLLGVPALGDAATLVQFSTPWCSSCPGTRRLLDELAEPTDDVRVVEIDVAHRPDLADRFSISQTPTVLLLDRGGAVRSRIAGASTRAILTAELDSVRGRTPS